MPEFAMDDRAPFPEDARGAGRAAMRAEVRAGLARRQKELPAKYFYDARGSALFERITQLPEYYLTRAERALLVRWAPAWMCRLRCRSLVELGAGSAIKTRVILDAMQAAGGGRAYVPVDVSAEFLDASAAELRADYPGVRIAPVVADFTAGVPLPADLPGPVLVAFLGSTLGNFDDAGAVALLARVAQAMTAADHLLLGVDLEKDTATLEAAYNDVSGVTAEFNRNMLRVLNRELGADFDVAAFRHRAFFDRARHRIEMHLVADRAMSVRVPGVGDVRFAAGESVRTEISTKYDRARVSALLGAAGLAMDEWEGDEAGQYALLLARLAP
ncbi:MAG TPA: L-histidine N(alpha)-methyltransferase [Gemmatimonadaceae bacterium]|nr:L-histidine N(alpha)-methyltransferase [Gemmatimonadaceae bacterium]